MIGFIRTIDISFALEVSYVSEYPLTGRTKIDLATLGANILVLGPTAKIVFLALISPVVVLAPITLSPDVIRLVVLQFTFTLCPDS